MAPGDSLSRRVYAGPMAATDGATLNEGGGTCLIAGCGYVGARLARRRAAREVLGLVRTPGTAAALAATGISARAVDFDIPGALEVPPGLASIVYTVPPPSTGTEDPRLQRFLEGLGLARPRVMVYLSTTGVYGDTGGLPVDEGSPVAPGDDASRRRLAAEAAAQTWCRSRGVRCVLLRVPGIYGPHRLPLERLERGEPVLRPEDARPGNRIHVDDLVAACAAALDRPVSGVFNVVDGYHASIGAFMEQVAALAGLPAPRRITLAEARRELSPGFLAYLETSRRVETGRMQADLGLQIRFADLEQGIRQSLTEMGR